MNDSNISSAMDLSFLSQESNIQQIGTIERTDTPKTTEKRKRGRPRTKPVIPTALDADGNPIKKQRGRPRKVLTDATDTDGEKNKPLDENGVPLKKRRGRPKKSLIDSTSVTYPLGSSNKSTAPNGNTYQDSASGYLAVASKSDASTSSQTNPDKINKQGRPKKIDVSESSKSKTSTERTDYAGVRTMREKQNEEETSRPKKSERLIEHFDSKRLSHRSDVFGIEGPQRKVAFPENEEHPELIRSINGISNDNLAYKEREQSASISSDESYLPTNDLSQVPKSEPRGTDHMEFTEQNLPERTSKILDSSIQPKAPRRRGRPKKVRDESAEPKVKRPRGRPPKEKHDKDRPQQVLNTEKLYENQWTLNNMISINDSKGSHVEDTSLLKPTEKNKDVFLNFKKNQEKATKPNTILDDSYDVFSFDNNGTSNFVIPEDALPSQSAKKNNSQKTSPMKPLKEQLELIDTNIQFSDENESDIDYSISESQNEGSSSPVQSPSDPRLDSLRPDEELKVLTGPTNDLAKSQNILEKGPTTLKEEKSRVNSLGENSCKATSPHLSEEWSLSLSFQDVKGQGTPDASPLSERNTSFKPIHSSPNLVTDVASQKPESLKQTEQGAQSSSENDLLTKFSAIKELPSWQALNSNLLTLLDGDITTLNEYFNDLLSYMNKTDASLASDTTGELTFFINNMPNEELALKFNNWIDQKANEIFMSFENKINNKVTTLHHQFEIAKELIQGIDNDAVLIEFANRFNIKF
ncbi:unnamed protein product [Kluyveromyces dobzhanskii CBS 2104]|uniref:WGS project CCBQ000000000 data, contig 00106 n=1 Tax=Kluyveromyces dobzhanskii CBS 2104 TaxID=1427455 RepID=A0A0A8L8B9_9SACH|nr:unnamed protein product [Kluyveromyces dobzhanskii CBS 2104]